MAILNSLLTQKSFLQTIAAALDGQMPRPSTFGLYHFICLAIVVALSVLVVLKCRRFSDNQYDLFLAITTGVLVLFELYKQFNFSYDWETDTWSYQWYSFPFQFCSTPLYVMPLALIFRKQTKIRDAFRAFLGSYALFAGAAVMVYPSTVYIETIGINIQTMVHHGAMVLVGVLTHASGKAKPKHTTVLKAVPVFLVAAAIALTMNILFYHFVSMEEGVNMFFISPYETCVFPFLDYIQSVAPYPVFLLAYILGFSAVAYLVTLPAILLTKKRQKENEQ